MDINKLPNGLQELARKRKEEDSDVEWFGCGVKLAHAFNWGKTKEGWQFWEDIYHEKFDIYTETYSNHEWIGDYPGEYQVIDGTLVVVRDYVGRESFEYGAASSIGTKLHEDVDISSLTITPAVLANGYYAGEGVKQEIKDAWKHGYEFALNSVNLSDLMWDSDDSIPKNAPDKVYHTTKVDDCSAKTKEGIKESGGKADYSEINFEVLDIMAARFEANKHKYPKGNMLKPIEINSLLWPIFRHWKKMMFPLKDDVETFEDHLAAILCNSSMILDQLKLKKDEVQSGG